MFNLGTCAGLVDSAGEGVMLPVDSKPMSQAVADTGGDTQLGRAFAEALGRKDFDGVQALLASEIDFRGLTPRRNWEATSSLSVVEDVLRTWFKDSVEIDELVSIETDSFSDRKRIAYRFHGRNEDGPFVIEQQAYYGERDGRIEWMRVLCSGYRPRG
jgi:hypothetical protein